MAINTSFGSGSSSGGSSSSSGTAYSPAATQRINQLYPYIQGQLPTAGAMNFGSLLGSVGGSTPKYPTITTGGVYSPQDIQNRVNSTRAGNDSSTAGQIRQMQGNLAGRGFGASSPLGSELQTQMQGQNLATNTQAENDIRFNAAQANATQLLASQQANVARSAEMSQDEVRRRQLALQGQQQLMQQQASLLAALYGYNQPLPFSQSQSQQQSRQQNSSLGDSFQDNTPMPSISGHIDVAGNRNNFWG